MEMLNGFCLVPQAKASELFKVDLSQFDDWICLEADGCSSLFVYGNNCWESHWTCKDGTSAFKAVAFCRKSIQEVCKVKQVKKFYGITPMTNIRALKVARILGYIPVVITDINEVPYLISVKEM